MQTLNNHSRSSTPLIPSDDFSILPSAPQSATIGYDTLDIVCMAAFEGVDRFEGLIICYSDFRGGMSEE